MVRLTGYVATNAGVSICGAAVAIFPTSVAANQGTSVCSATATTTTNSVGLWDELALAANKYDARITCGSSVRWHRYADEIQHATFQTGDGCASGLEGNIYWGLSNDVGMRWSTADSSNHAFVIGLGDTSQQIHITDMAAIATDWARSAGTHPELAIHSNTTPITDYLAIGNHDGATASIDVVGGATLALAIAGNTELTVTAAGLTVPANSDINFTGTTGTNDIVLTNGLADALSITDGSADVVVVDTSTAGNVITLTSALTVGVNGTGHDVKFFGCESGAYFLYDESEETLEIRGAAADATTSTGKLLLSTALTNINACDVIGSINFQAPLEAGGTDATEIAAGIRAVAQATFTCAVNATDLIFYTGHSEAAAERFRFTSQNEIGIAGANYGSNGQVLTSGGTGAAVAWEDAAGGPTEATTSDMSEETPGTTNANRYVSPEVAVYHPGVAKAWAMFQGNISTPEPQVNHNVASIIDNGTGSYSLCYDVNMGSTTYVVLAHSNYNHVSQQSGLNVAHTGEVGFANNCHSAVDTTNTFIAVFGAY